MTIAEFHHRLGSAGERDGLFSALRQLTRIEEPRRLAWGRSGLVLWQWHASPETPRATVETSGTV